jgi:hypothetical protein
LRKNAIISAPDMRAITLCETWPQVLSRRQEWRPCSSPN